EVAGHESENSRAVGQAHHVAQRQHRVAARESRQRLPHQRHARFHREELVNAGFVEEQDLHARASTPKNTSANRAGSMLPPETRLTTRAPDETPTRRASTAAVAAAPEPST